MAGDDFEAQAERYAVLEEPQRRAIYLFVRGARRAVTREDVAAAVGVSRSLAAFHLERLLDAGLVTADFARPAGRRGPGSGRPAKRYLPSGAEIAIEIPARRYALAGRMLARAIDESGSAPTARDAALRIAAEEGRRHGEDRASEAGPRDASVAMELLSELGFEPLVDETGTVTLANCPFHALAETAPDLVCGMNVALVQGLVDGLGIDALNARLAPEEGRCCVVLTSCSRPSVTEER